MIKPLSLVLLNKNNFTNESLHVIGQQLNRIEEKIVEKTVSVEQPVSRKSISVKTEKPLIDLPSQREKVMFKTSQSKTLEVVEKMLSGLKVKMEGQTKPPTNPKVKEQKERKKKKEKSERYQPRFASAWK